MQHRVYFLQLYNMEARAIEALMKDLDHGMSISHYSTMTTNVQHTGWVLAVKYPIEITVGWFEHNGLFAEHPIFGRWHVQGICVGASRQYSAPNLH